MAEVLDHEQEQVTSRALARSLDIINRTLDAITPKFQERQFYLNMYHSFDEVLKLKQWWQSKFAHPFPFYTTEMKSSFYYEGVFGTNNQGLWEVEPWSEESLASARNISKLMKYQEDNSNFLETFYVGAKSLSITGDWFLETFWDQQERDIQLPSRYEIGLDEIGRPMPKLVRGEKKRVTDKSQPDARTLLTNSVWPDVKGCVSLETSRYFCVRREYAMSYLKKAEANGTYIDTDKIPGTGMPKMPGYYYDSEPYLSIYKSGNSQSTSGSSPIDEEDPLVEVIEIWYPLTGEVESVANRAVYLGRRQAYMNLKCPFVHIKNFEEHGKFFGTSDYRAIAGHWKLVNQYQSLEADNMLFHYRGYTTIQRDAGPNVQEAVENLRPGSVIMTNSQGSITHDRPDLMSPYTFQAKQALINESLQPMGMNEILQGATPSSNVRSSDQFSQLANFGAKMMSQGIRNVAQGLKSLGVKWLQLNYEFLDIAKTVPILGPGGTEIIKIEPGEIPVTANVSVRLSADLESAKAQKIQQLMQMMGVSQTVPGFGAQKFAKEIFRTNGAITEDPDKYFLLSDDQSAQLTLSQFGMGGGAPQNPAMAGSTRPPHPNQVRAGATNSGRAEVPGVR